MASEEKRFLQGRNELVIISVDISVLIALTKIARMSVETRELLSTNWRYDTIRYDNVPEHRFLYQILV